MRQFHNPGLAALAAAAAALGATMVAATAITRNDRPGGHQQAFTFVLDPGSIASGASEAETVAIPGVAVGDVAVLTPRGAIPAGIVVSPVRCVAGALNFNIENNSAGAVDLASFTWDVVILRGTDMAFAG
jgi:hypothetical protein